MRKIEKQGSDAVLKFSEHKRKRIDELEADVDALFRLPLAEFTGARNALAAQLKKSGRGDESVRVKALAKPSISAWAVNQLYWNHREEFGRLIASGDRFHKAQTSRSGGKVADMREALDARREALTHLSDLATSLLRDAGHTPSLETIRRFTTTLEGISAYAQRSDGRHTEGPGRLTHDVDPPGFESLSGFSSSAGMERQEADGGRQVAGTPSRVTSSRESSSGAASKRNDDVRQLAETRKANIAAAKVSLQDAKRSLTEARARAQSLEAAQKKAEAEEKKTEKQRREAEEELRKAKAASEDAARSARSVTVDVEEAAKAVEDAELTVEEASKELESLLRES
jgi:DNA repair exonuclease SbcCD ATPase subunit